MESWRWERPSQTEGFARFFPGSGKTTIPIFRGVGRVSGKLERLSRNASQCRMLADGALTVEARQILQDMAKDYEDRAATLQGDRSSEAGGGTKP